MYFSPFPYLFFFLFFSNNLFSGQVFIQKYLHTHISCIATKKWLVRYNCRSSPPSPRQSECPWYVMFLFFLESVSVWNQKPVGDEIPLRSHLSNAISHYLGLLESKTKSFSHFLPSSYWLPYCFCFFFFRVENLLFSSFLHYIFTSVKLHFPFFSHFSFQIMSLSVWSVGQQNFFGPKTD